MVRGHSALINKTRRLGDWLRVGGSGGVWWLYRQKFPSILQQVTVATETRSHAVQLTTEPVVQVGLEVVARGIESNVFSVCVYKNTGEHRNTLHTKAAPLMAKYKSLLR